MIIVEADVTWAIPLEPVSVRFTVLAEFVFHRLRQVHAVIFVGLDLLVVIKHVFLLGSKCCSPIDLHTPSSQPLEPWQATEVSTKNGRQNTPEHFLAGRT